MLQRAQAFVFKGVAQIRQRVKTTLQVVADFAEAVGVTRVGLHRCFRTKQARDGHLRRHSRPPLTPWPLPPP